MKQLLRIVQISTLIAALVTSSLSLAKEPGIVVSDELPDHGALDSFHSVPLSPNAPERDTNFGSALYALRTHVVLDLLKTRKALKALLGGEDRLKNQLGRKDLSFRAPPALLNLYKGGKLRVLEASEAIHYLWQPETLDVSRREKLSTELLYISAQIAKLDQQIKFLEEDFWKDPGISKQFYAGFVEPLIADLPTEKNTTSYATVRERAKEKWMRDHGVIGQLEQLMGNKAAVLERYRVLSTDVGGKPLYQWIYQVLEKNGFPGAATYVQHAVSPSLPADEIPLPDEFESIVNAHFDYLASSSGASARAGLVAQVASELDRALIQCLEQNTKAIEALAAVVEYSPADTGSPMLALGSDPNLWKAARERYAYLQNRIDFDSAEQIAKSIFDQRKAERSARDILSAVAVGGPLVLSLAVPGLGEASLYGLSVLGSGVFVANSVQNYVDSKNVAQAAKFLYFGSARTGSHEKMSDAVALSKSDFQSMMLSLLIVVGHAPKLIQLAKASVAIEEGTGGVVARVSKKFISEAQSSLKEAATRARVFLPYMNGALQGAARAMGIAEEQVQLIELERTGSAISATSASVKANLSKIPGMSKLVEQWKGRVLVDEKLARNFWIEQGANLAITIAGEYAERGNAIFGEQKLDFIKDLVLNCTVTGLYIVQLTPYARSAEEALVLKNQRVPYAFWTEDLKPIWKLDQQNLKTRASRLWNQGKPFFVIGAGAAAVSTGVPDLILHFKGDERFKDWSEVGKDLGKNVLFSGMFSAVSSNIRFQFTSGLRDSVIYPKWGAKSAQGWGSYFLVSTTNNGFGAWSYPFLAKFFHAQDNPQGKREVDVDGEEVWVQADPHDANPAAYLFPELATP